MSALMRDLIMLAIRGGRAQTEGHAVTEETAHHRVASHSMWPGPTERRFPSPPPHCTPPPCAEKDDELSLQTKGGWLVGEGCLVETGCRGAPQRLELRMPGRRSTHAADVPLLAAPLFLWVQGRPRFEDRGGQRMPGS